MFPIADLDDVDMAFPSGVLAIMPDWKDIPDAFKAGRTSWNEIVRAWFFRGLKQFEPKPKEGVDVQKAMRHLTAIMRSFQPKHEHKDAAVAYLLSQWFEENPAWAPNEQKK